MGRIFEVRPTDWEVDHVGVYQTLKSIDTLAEIPLMPFWKDIIFRYERNPIAFSINHPNFKLELDRLSEPITYMPVIPNTPFIDGGTPEPSGLILGLIAIACIWWRHR